MEKDYYIHGKNKGGRVQKRSKLPLIGGLLALAVLIFALCFILFRPDAPAPEDPDQGQVQGDVDPNGGEAGDPDTGETSDGDGEKGDGAASGDGAGTNPDGNTGTPDGGADADEGDTQTPDTGSNQPSGGTDTGSKDESKDEPKDESKDEPKDEPKDEGKVTPVIGPEPIPDPQKESRPWNLVLVNPWNTLPDNNNPPVVRVNGPYTGWTFDERANADLRQMLEDCDAQPGLYPIVCSSFRTWSTQENLFNKKVKTHQNRGLSYADAVTAAAKETAWPGTSEHQLGLAVDIVDKNNQLLTDAQADTPVQQWLMANCWKYGFILRYPADKTHITGIKYEPWHYRYVGKDYAKAIYDSGLCLEEWLAQN